MVLKQLLTQIELPFYQKLLEKGEFVEIEKFKNLSLEEPYVDIRAKECFRNATLVTLSNPDIKYCLGYSFNLIPFEHAWNSYQGKYFDLTNEEIIKSDSMEYLKVYEFTQKELWDYLEKNKNVPPDLFSMGFMSTD